VVPRQTVYCRPLSVRISFGTPYFAIALFQRVRLALRR
jgi:hypothetical protein